MTEDLIERLRTETSNPDMDNEAADALAAQAKRIAVLEDAEVHLGNLLARIHRDGGHYQAQHGTFRAVGAAASAWYELVARAECAEARIAELDRLLALEQSVRKDATDRAKEYSRKADKAEAELAAARAALRHADTCDWMWKVHHADAIAAARGEKEKTDDQA